MDAKKQIRKYIAQSFLFYDDGFELRDDSSFIEEGIIDSTGVLELVLFVEETFDLQIDDDDIIPDNFDTVDKLTTFIERETA